jgi:hypothetical protein
MKRINFVLISAVIACGQSSVIDSGSADTQKFGFYWETRLDPGTPEMGLGFGRQTFSESSADRLTVYRIFVDRRAETYFGYVAAVSLTEANLYSLSVVPLVLTPDVVQKFALGIDKLTSWRQLPFQGLSPQRLQRADVVGFTLLSNPATGQRITEAITIGERSLSRPSFDPQPRREFSSPPGEPRDLTAADVEFTLNFPRISTNGASDGGANGIRLATGRTIVVEVPKVGRFTLSLVPHAGFANAGEVRGTSLRFKTGGDTVEIQSATRIAPSDAAFILYVRRDGSDLGIWGLGTGGAPICKGAVVC